jgi:stage IV sporulation protein FB
MLEWMCLGIRFRLSLWFPASVILMLSADQSGVTLLCLLASVSHELGHFLMMVLLHDTPETITLGIFGMHVERRQTQTVGYATLSAVALAGPLVNVGCYVLLQMTGASVAALIHGVLAFFQLLPIASLDGGEALYAALCRRHTEQNAERTVTVCSVIALIPLAVLSVALLLSQQHNFTLLILVVYLILRMFLHKGH